MKYSTLFILMFLPVLAFAQPQQFEFVLGGGVSFNTAASDNMPYKADKMIPNYTGNFKFLYNTPDNLQLGLELGASELAGKTTHSYYNHNTNVSIVGNDGKLLVYSRVTPVAIALLNYRLDLHNSYVYGGIGFGYAQAIDKHEHNDNEGYVTPDGGHGYVAGLQLGYAMYFSRHFGFDVQVAARYYGLFYNAHIPTGPSGLDQEKLQYGIAAFPATIGVKYRIFNKKTPPPVKSAKSYQAPAPSESHKKNKSGKDKHVYW